MSSGYFVCQICESYHDSIEELNAHYEKDHPQKHQHKSNIKTKYKRKFECDQCNKRLQTKVLLNYHKKWVHYVTTEPPLGEFNCDICDKRYRSRQMLKRHMKNVHDVTLPALLRCPGRTKKTDKNLLKLER